MQGPFEIELKVHVSAGENVGVITYTMPPGIYPTRETVDAAVQDAVSGACKGLGEDVQVLSRPEFAQRIAEERLGVTEEFAWPAEWDK